MASAFLDGYKVGLISASLKPKGKEKHKNKEENTNTLLFDDTILQPKFIAVAKKILKKDPAEKTKETVSNSNNEEEVKLKRKKSIKDDDFEIKTKKQKRLPLNKSADDDPERLGRTIFVGNLPIATSRKELTKFFKKYGAIESTRLRSVAVPDFKTSKKLASIKKDFNPNRSNVNGYVVFKVNESVEKALESNGKMIGDLCIRVDRVGGEGKQYDHKRSIFVGNLNFGIKEEDVRSLFTVCGDVQTIRIIRDAATGIGKGFGYVLFKDASSVSLALKMSNSELCGRKIRVQASQENPRVNNTKGNMTKKVFKPQEKFSGMQAKQTFYQKRKTQKQQQNFLSKSNTKKNASKFKKHDKRTTLRNKK